MASLGLAVGAVSLALAAPGLAPAIAAPGGTAAEPRPPREAPAGSAAATVSAAAGRVLVDVVSASPSPLRRKQAMDLCVTLGSDAAGETSICVVAKRWAKVARPGSASLRVPARIRRTGGAGVRVALRQADLMIPAGPMRVAVTCAAGCSATPAAITLPPLIVESCRARQPSLVHSAQDKLGKAVAITFDDGPGPATRDVLQILKRHGVPATFFQIGRMIEQDPGILQRIRRQGHVLGNHTYSHPVLRGGEKRELSRTQRLIRRKGGFETCLFRAPYGENPPAVVARAGSMGLQTVHWNVDPGDWRGLNARQMVATSLRQTGPGSILVFHDGEDHADMVAGLPRLLESLRQRGYRFLTVPELLRLDIRYR